MTSSYTAGGGMAAFPVLDLEATSALDEFPFGDNMSMFSNTNFDEYGVLGGVVNSTGIIEGAEFTKNFVDFNGGEAVVKSPRLETGALPAGGGRNLVPTPEGGVSSSGVDFARDDFQLSEFQGFEHLLSTDSSLTTTSTAALIPAQVSEDTNPYQGSNIQSSSVPVTATPAPAVTASRNSSAAPDGGNKRKAEPVVGQQKKRSNTSMTDSPAASASTPGLQEDAYGLTAEEDKRRRNTAASARFRVKKKQREQALESTAKEMTEKVGNLEARISQLEMENKLLRNLLTEKNGKMDFEQVMELCKKWAQPQPQPATHVPISGPAPTQTPTQMQQAPAKERGRSRPAQKDGVGTGSGSGAVKKAVKVEL